MLYTLDMNQKSINLPGGAVKVKRPVVKSDVNKAVRILKVISAFPVVKSTANAKARA